MTLFCPKKVTGTVALTAVARVAVCIVTFSRPGFLRQLLQGLHGLTFLDATPDVRIIVVDNDARASARAVCDEAERWLRWPLLHVVEPRPGISHARNRALALALPDRDYVAFIDDDEVPEPDWLDELLRVIQEHHADVCTGPVRPRFLAPPPGWYVRGEFYPEPRHATGQPLARAWTGNLLLRTALLRETGLTFDPRYGLSGGEDNHFVGRLGAQGRTIVWAERAVAYEWVTPDRLRPTWIWKRAAGDAATEAAIQRELRPTWRTLVRLLLQAVYQFVKGGVDLVAGAMLLEPHRCVAAVRRVCKGAGTLAGLSGRFFKRYRARERGGS